MKINIQTRVLLRLFVVIMFFSTLYPVNAQELVRGNYNYIMCDTSIVRESSRDTVFIYNYNYYKASFMRVIANDMITQIIHTEPVFVNDFEVFENKIYFCGYRLEEGMKTAVFGYFSLITFPNCYIYYEDVPQCKELKKIDVYQIVNYQFLSENHLVMTGTTDDIRSDALIDMTIHAALPTGGQMFISTDENESIDDVAVTNNYVVVSSRSKVQGIPVVNFCYYNKPLSLGYNIFSTSSNRFQVSSPVAETPVFLEHTKNNNFAAVYKVNGYSRIATLLMEVSSNFFTSFEIMVSNAGVNYPMDIKYNTYNMGDTVYSILVRGNNRNDPDFNPPMQIFHITSSNINGVVTMGSGTTYSEIYYRLWSIDPLRKTSDCFVASGDAAQSPVLLQFNNYQDGVCLDKFIYRFDIGKMEGSRKEEHVPIMFLDEEMIKLIPKPLSIQFPAECGGK